MDMVGFQLWSLLHQVVVTTNNYDFGMIDACASFIEEGLVQFFTLSSLDSESWLATWKNAHDQAEMHRAYERYVIEEAILLSSTRQVGLMA